MRPFTAFLCSSFLLGFLTGCSGGGGSSSLATTSTGTTATGALADFSLAIAPQTLTIAPGGPAQTLTVTASALNGFSGNVAVSVVSLPNGVTASPMTLSVAPGTLQQISLSAASTASAGNNGLSVQGVAGSLTHLVTATVAVGGAPASPTAPATLSDTSFDFGDNLVNNAVTKSVVTVTNSGTGALTLNPSLSGDPSYSIVGTGSCGTQLAPAASCPMMVSYTPKTASSPAAQNAVLSLGLGNVPAGTPETVALSGTSTTLSAGQVTVTDNPQVALYTMTLPFPGSVTVNFGKDTTYGTKTWTQSTAQSGGQVSIFVAGMQGNSTYHMQAAVQFTNGISANDTDHTFTTQPVPAKLQPRLTVASTPGTTPQPGVELLDMVNGTPSGVAVTDLAGNVLWTYAAPGAAVNFVQGVKLLPNGDFLMSVGPLSTAPLNGIAAGTISEIREVNLAGDTVREITVADLNALLANATCAECNVFLQTFHHDVEPLPNGHWLVLANTVMNLSPTTTPALTNYPPGPILGDVVIDLDENLRPVWAWNAFNHLKPNYHPYMFPDWTHANALLYSPSDGNLLISIRHMNRVLKLDYKNGTGSGSVLWRMGEGGELTLKNGTDPADWAYAQHYPSFFSSNTSGVFSLGVMDNGNDRIFAPNIACGKPTNPPCLYTTIPVYQIDENAMTATLVFHQILPTNLYSYFGGSVDLLANANIEYALSAVGADSYIFEVTPQSTPQTVWTMHVTGTNVYRGTRIPSLYPGVQW